MYIWYNFKWNQNLASGDYKFPSCCKSHVWYLFLSEILSYELVFLGGQHHPDPGQGRSQVEGIHGEGELPPPLILTVFCRSDHVFLCVNSYLRTCIFPTFFLKLLTSFFIKAFFLSSSKNPRKIKSKMAA